MKVARKFYSPLYEHDGHDLRTKVLPVTYKLHADDDYNCTRAPLAVAEGKTIPLECVTCNSLLVIETHEPEFEVELCSP